MPMSRSASGRSQRVRYCECVGWGWSLFRHHDPHRPKSIAKPAALAFHQLAGPSALLALGCNLEFGVGGVRHVAGSYLYDLGPVMLAQPRSQFAFNLFSVCNTESRR